MYSHFYYFHIFQGGNVYCDVTFTSKYNHHAYMRMVVKSKYQKIHILKIQDLLFIVLSYRGRGEGGGGLWSTQDRVGGAQIGSLKHPFLLTIK